jgi:hypothetical protein
LPWFFLRGVFVIVTQYKAINLYPFRDRIYFLEIKVTITSLTFQNCLEASKAIIKHRSPCPNLWEWPQEKQSNDKRTSALLGLIFETTFIFPFHSIPKVLFVFSGTED